jgi:hypothetical protein
MTGTPGHVNSMARSVVHFIREFPVETMKPGDLYWYNDCYGSRGAVSVQGTVVPRGIGDLVLLGGVLVLAGTVLGFLVHPLAGFITGEIIDQNGGLQFD